MEIPVLSRSAENAEIKHSDIIRSAESLFLQQGFGATSMDRIAEEAKVTKQTVYRYFPSKEALFAAVMQHVRGRKSEPHAFSSAPLIDELISYGGYLLALHLKPKALGVYRLMLIEGAQENLSQTFMEAGPQRVMQPLIEFLEQRCPALDDPQFHAQMFATMIVAPRNRLLMGGGNRMGTSAQKEHVEKVVRLFIKAIEP